MSFEKLGRNWLAAVEGLQDYQKQHPGAERTDPKLVEKQKKVTEERLATEAYNRYTISVRGAPSKVYRILARARVEKEFETLLTTTMPSPTTQDEAIQHMRPLERLGGEFTAWMCKYVAGQSKEQSMDVDV